MHNLFNKLKYLPGFILLINGSIAIAQFNDTTHHFTSFLSSGSVNRTRGGTAYLLNNGLRFGIKQRSISLNLNNNWVYGKQNSSLTNNDFSSVLEVNIYKSFPHFFYWGLVNYNTSHSLKINYQLLSGLGVAYSVIDRKNAYLNISDGLLYDQSNLLLNNQLKDVYHTFRNSLRLSYRWDIHDVIMFEGSNFLQSSLHNSNDYIIRSANTLTFKLNTWLGLATSLNYNLQNRTKNDNLLFTYGLTIEKYF